MIPSDELKNIRVRLGLSIRDVEEFAQKIAVREENNEYRISNAFLSQIENGESTPSIFKLISLSAIYGTKYTDLLRIFGADIERISLHQLSIGSPDTHIAEFEIYDEERSVAFPVQFDPSFKLEKTALVSRIVEIWGEVPVALLQHLNLRQLKYGFIGLKDFTLYPLLRPGSFVQIDDRRRQYQTAPWRSEYERPIYFVELRDGYACSWCELQSGTLTLIPHPLSPCKIRQFRYPRDAEIVGRVTGVAMRVVDSPNQRPEDLSRLPAHT